MKNWQEINDRAADYARPNQRWVCGRACLGAPCMEGPDAHGVCRATSECHPLRKGDRWHCTRPAAAGGPCATGPLPDGACCRPVPRCVPSRSLRSWRGLTTTAVATVTTGLLALLLASDRGRDFVSPGELSFAHSSSKSQCADCHPGIAGPPVAWLGTLTNTAAQSDSRLCLNCHHMGEAPFHAHGQSPAELAGLTQRAASRATDGTRPVALALGSLMAKPAGQAAAELACAACHKEHRGKEHDLKQLGNLQCQSCHARQFTSLANGHPAFEHYPFKQRTRIIFDHLSHLKEHFHEAQFKSVAPASCADCHEPDERGHTMQVKAFARVCAACHADQIHGRGRAGAPGIAFLRVPGLDAATLAERGLAVGDWPEFAEGRPTPFMEWLLAGEPGVPPALTKLAKVDLLDLADADADTLKAASQLAWAVKGLFFDLLNGGQPGLKQRFESQVKSPPSRETVADLTGALSADVIDSAIGNWFPRLATEIAEFRSAGKLKSARATKPPPPGKAKAGANRVKPEDWVESGGWYRSDLDYAVLYRPKGHADNFLTGWLSLTANAAALRSPQPAARVFQELAAPKAPGLCAKCHSVDDHPVPRMNWQPARFSPARQEFTKFSHASHLSLLGDQGCLSCHGLNLNAPAGSYLAAFAQDNRDSARFQSNFKPIERNVCASCHTPRFAGDSCLLCHNYHVTRLRPATTVTMKAKMQPDKLTPTAR